MRVATLIAPLILALTACGRSELPSFEEPLANDGGITTVPASSVVSLPSGKGSPVPTPTPLDETDGGFGQNGRVGLPFGSADAHARRAALVNDGIVVAGTMITNATDTGLARYTMDGVLDTNFANVGWVDSDLGRGTKDFGLSVAADGTRTFVAGAKYDSNGLPKAILSRFDGAALDTTFASNGTIELTTWDQSAIGGVVADADGSAFVSIDAVKGSYRFWAVAHVLASGALDASFASSGVYSEQITSAYNSAALEDIALLPDGGVLMVGTVGGMVRAEKLDAQGRLDATFGGDGRAGWQFSNASASVSTVSVDADGRALVCGDLSSSSTSKAIVMRILPDGTLDPSFDGNGVAVIDVGGVAHAGRAVSRASDGRVLVAVSANGLGEMRLLEDGTPDASFGMNGWALSATANAHDSVHDGVLLPDGRFVVVGTNADSPDTFVLAGFRP